MSPRPWPLTVTCHATSQLSLSLSGCAQLYCAPLSRGGDGDGDDMMMMGRASWVLSVVTARLYTGSHSCQTPVHSAYKIHVQCPSVAYCYIVA